MMLKKALYPSAFIIIIIVSFAVQNEIYYYLSFNLYFLLQRCIKFSVYSLHDFNNILSCDERIISRYFFPFFLSIFDIIIIVVNSFSCLCGVWYRCSRWLSPQVPGDRRWWRRIHNIFNFVHPNVFIPMFICAYKNMRLSFLICA